MKKYLSLLVLPLFVLASQSALAGKCEVDIASLVSINDAQLTFNPLITTQIIRVTNNGAEALIVTSSVSSQWFDSTKKASKKNYIFTEILP